MKVNSKWMDRPISIVETTEPMTHALFIDENGDSDMSYIIKNYDKEKNLDENAIYFSVTSALCKAENLKVIHDEFIDLKAKYWPPDGCYEYQNHGNQKVCFHSNEIRRQKGPFSKNTIDMNLFITDLTNSMKNLPISLCTCFINKEQLYSKFRRLADNPYDLAVTYILKRIVKDQLKDTDKLIIILESRGKLEDKKVLSSIVNLIKFGNDYVKASYFEKIIGVYFNNKRPDSDCKKSFFGLEVADLCAYPIFKYCKRNKKDQAFLVIEDKIYGYPKYEGNGLKKMP